MGTHAPEPILTNPFIHANPNHPVESGVIVADGLDVELAYLTNLRRVVLKSLETRVVVVVFTEHSALSIMWRMLALFGAAEVSWIPRLLVVAHGGTVAFRFLPIDATKAGHASARASAASHRSFTSSISWKSSTKLLGIGVARSDICQVRAQRVDRWSSWSTALAALKHTDDVHRTHMTHVLCLRTNADGHWRVHERAGPDPDSASTRSKALLFCEKNGINPEHILQLLQHGS